MSEIQEVLSVRQKNLVAEVKELSKNKFFAMRSLSYCLGFIGASVERLNSHVSVEELSLSLSSENHLPSEWIVNKSSDLISKDFETYDLITNYSAATRMVNYLRSQLFIALMMELEDYLNQLLKIVLLAHPERLRSEHFNFEQVVMLENAENFISEKVDKKIREKQYGRPRQFFNFVKSSLDVDGSLETILDERGINDPATRKLETEKLSLEGLFPKYLEMKSRRDVGVHAGWIRNDLYDERIAKLDITNSQEVFLGVSSDYFKEATDVAIDMVAKCNMFCELGFTNAD